MTGVLLGLASGVSWGIADFFGGFSSRRMAAVVVACVTQIIGTALLVAVILAVRPSLPPADALALGAAGGVCGALGVFAFYKALATGTMSLVAPVSALGAAVPVAFGLIDGERPSRLVLAGVVIALGGAVLASRAPGRATRDGLGLAVLAALMFGGFFVLIEPAAQTDPLWAALSTRVTSVPILVGLCLLAGAGFRVARGLWPFVIAAGVLDVVANVTFAAATQRGLLSVVSVLAGLYPVATVILAQIVLKERLSPGQSAGVAAALVGVTLIAAG